MLSLWAKRVTFGSHGYVPSLPGKAVATLGREPGPS